MNVWRNCRQLAVAALCVIAVVAGAQTTWYVAMTGVDSNDAGRGKSWELPFRTISNGVAKALAGDTVMVSNGVYTNLTELIISRDITLKSANGAAVTVIDGNHPTITNRCMKISSLNAVVDGFTIYNGYAPIGLGGGVLIDRGGTVVNCNIVSNKAGSGSGYGGGGVVIDATGLVANCLIAWNTTPNPNTHGGGVTLKSGTTNALLLNCIIAHNTASRNGAGIYFFGGIARYCLVQHNRTGGGSGGGSFLFNAGLLENCTIVSNSCTNGHGGGVFMSSSSSGTGAVINCVVYSNVARSAATANIGISDGGVGVFSNSCYYPELPADSQAVSGNNTTNNPLFVGFAEGNYRLRSGSPCVNTAMLQPWMPCSDQDGHTVPDRFSGLPDMGCYELLRQGVMFRLK
ncbi:MAG: hypothetical protein ACOYCD_03200 [Kiritimatiellia bacterium]